MEIPAICMSIPKISGDPSTSAYLIINTKDFDSLNLEEITSYYYGYYNSTRSIVIYSCTADGLEISTIFNESNTSNETTIDISDYDYIKIVVHCAAPAAGGGNTGVTLSGLKMS